MTRDTAQELVRQIIRAAIIAGLVTGESAALFAHPEIVSLVAWVAVELWWAAAKLARRRDAG